MTEPGAPRVAVYLDFDNIVISRYDQTHGRNAFQKDRAAGFHKQPGRLTEATVDVGAIIDFASSFGTLVLHVPTRTGRPTSTPNTRVSSSAAPSTWFSCSPPRHTPRTGPTSGWRWTRSRTCSGCRT